MKNLKSLITNKIATAVDWILKKLTHETKLNFEHKAFIISNYSLHQPR